MYGGRDFVGAIRGPVMLITVGILFAIDHLTPYGFWETWPVILIVVGILSLVRRSGAGRTPYYSGPGAPPVPPAGAPR